MEKEIKIKDKTYFFVEVPFDAHSFREKLIMDGAGLYVSYEPRIEPYSALQSVKISKDNKENYKIISTTKDITKKQAENIVEECCCSINDRVVYGFIDYWKKINNYQAGAYFLAKESLKSLIQANELDIEKNYLILLKN